MKAKLFSVFLTFILFSTMYLPTGFTQDSTKWGLPGGAEARLGKGVISAIAYSPSGSRLAVASRTGIWIYDAVTGEERSLLGAHTGMITSIAYSRDGKMLASAHNVHGYIKNREFYVALWDATTGTLIKTLSHKSDRNISPIKSIAFSPDGTRIAVGDNEGGLLWNVGTGTLIGTLDHNRSIWAVTFSPDGRTIASAHDVHHSAPLALWDGATGAFKKALHPTNGRLRNVAYSPDGTILACATNDGRVVLWDVAASLPIDTFVIFEGDSGNMAVVYSPDGKTIAVRDGQETSIWDAATGRLRHLLSRHSLSSSYSIAYSPDGRTVASGGDDGTVRFWNASTGALRHTITGHTNEVNAVAYSPDGNTLTIGGRYSVNTVSLWDVATSTLRNSLEIDTTDFGWSNVDSLAYSPDGSTIAGGNYQETYLWDAATHKIRHRLEWSYRSLGITYSPDGSAIAGGISSRTAALSPDGTKLVTPGGGLSGDTMASLWDVATGALIKSFTLSSNASGDALLVWDVATRRIIDKLTRASEDRYVHGLAYSPDGNTIAAASGASVYLWDAGATRLRYRLTEDTHDGHDYDVRSVTFSPDSTTLASGGGFFDRTVRLWDVKTGSLKNILKGHSNAVVSLAYSPDGTTLASGSHDGTVLLWGLTPSVPRPAMAPEFTEGSSATRAIAENTQLGVNIGTPVAATDADNDTLTYTLSGTDANAFSIDTTTGQLRTRSTLDYETKTTYTVTITVSDGSLSDTTTVRINVTNVDETPVPEAQETIISLSPSPVQSPAVGAQITFNLNIANGENVAGYNIIVQFEPIALRYVSSANADYLPPGALATPANVSGNTVTVAAASITGEESDGDGTLATITFEVVAAKASTIRLTRVILSDSASNQLQVTSTDGIVTGPAAVDLVSGRTRQVRDAIVSAAGVGSAAKMTAAHLAAIEQLDLNNKGITALKASDFDGFTSLTGLNLGGNDFNTLLLQDIFDKLTSLTVLILPNNDFTTQLIGNLGGQVLTVLSDNYIAQPNELQGTMILLKVPSPRTVAGAVGDVNLDGTVNLLDLVHVIQNFGETGDNIADTNDDGVVDIADLVNVVGSFGQLSGAPSLPSKVLTRLTAAEVEELLTQARKLDLTNPMVQQWITALEHHLATLIPKETALLANYPNPFNPETWIPYQLSSPSDVTVHIYSVNGSLVRRLSLGHQAAGMYQSRSRAAYWDGKNEFGESVASGVYFYTLIAGDFTATRKMLIRK